MTIHRVVVQQDVLAQTVDELRQGGRARTERVSLWLGEKTEGRVLIREHYAPQYQAASDYFHIGRAAMARLMKHLRAREGLMIGAQLHTHPEAAFHSAADDKWAIVRHVGALSIVLPEFGRYTTPDTFIAEAKVFALSARNEWIEIGESHLHHYLEIAP